MAIYDWKGSPFQAGVQCSALRSTPPTNIDALKRCASARTLAVLWLGCSASVALLVYRGYMVRKREKDATTKVPYSLVVALAPFLCALVVAIIWPTMMGAQFAADSATFKASGQTPAEWMAARQNDERLSRSTRTSVLCACLIAGAGIFNTRWSVMQNMKR